MVWARSWYVGSRDRWREVLRALMAFDVDFSRMPVVISVGEMQDDGPSAPQRALFHAAIGELAAALGYTPGELKDEVKRIYFGDGWQHCSTEHLSPAQYGDLIEVLYRLGAWAGVVLGDRRAAR